MKIAASSPVVSVIIVSYNTRDMTLECLASIYAETRAPFQVIVHDNASTDGSVEAIAERFPQVELIADTINRGFGPAHKFAMEHVKAPWVLLLNPDTVVLKGAIDKLLAFAERTPEAGIWGGRTLYRDGSLNPTSCFARMTLWSLFCRAIGLNGIFRNSAIFNSEYYGNWQCDTERAVDIVTGCFLLIRRSDWDRLGGFDEAFVMFGEEVDLCLRGHKLGMMPKVTPEATIIHYGGASEAIRAERMVRLLRAKVLLIKRHFPAWQRPIGLALFRLWPWSRVWGSRLLGREGVATWTEIWARRNEWWEGWKDVTRS